MSPGSYYLHIPSPEPPAPREGTFRAKRARAGRSACAPTAFPSLHPLHPTLARTSRARAPLKIRTCGPQGRLEHAFPHPIQPTATSNPRACARAALRPDMHFAC
eukprot:5598998-Pleurochrysis_carterae.AAC.1